MQQWSFIGVRLLFVSSVVMSMEHDLSDDGAHGVRISGNDVFTVFARNSELTYELTFARYNYCEVPYRNDYNYFVYSLAVLTDERTLTNPPNFTFVQVAETMTPERQVILSILSIERFGRYCSLEDWYEIPIWNGTHQPYMQIKVDPQGRYAYVFADAFLLSFDILAMNVKQMRRIKEVFKDTYHPRAFDLTDTWAIVTGVQLTGRYYHYETYLMRLPWLNSTSSLGAAHSKVDSIAKVNIYDRDNDMSVAVNPQKNLTLVGFPRHERVLVVTTKGPVNNYDYCKILVKYDVSWPGSNMDSGRSVAWLTDEIVAVTMFNVPDRPWSRSEVWMFAVDQPFDKPLFVFPNNQQVVMLTPRLQFLHVFAWSNNLYLLTDQSKALLISTRPAGFLSVWASSTNDVLGRDVQKCLTSWTMQYVPVTNNVFSQRNRWLVRAMCRLSADYILSARFNQRGRSRHFAILCPNLFVSGVAGRRQLRRYSLAGDFHLRELLAVCRRVVNIMALTWDRAGLECLACYYRISIEQPSSCDATTSKTNNTLQKNCSCQSDETQDRRCFLDCSHLSLRLCLLVCFQLSWSVSHRNDSPYTVSYTK